MQIGWNIHDNLTAHVLYSWRKKQ